MPMKANRIKTAADDKIYGVFCGSRQSIHRRRAEITDVIHGRTRDPQFEGKGPQPIALDFIMPIDQPFDPKLL